MTTHDELDRLIADEREATDLPSGPPSGGYERLSAQLREPGAGSAPVPAPAGRTAQTSSLAVLGLVAILGVLGVASVFGRGRTGKEHTPRPTLAPEATRAVRTNETPLPTPAPAPTPLSENTQTAAPAAPTAVVEARQDVRDRRPAEDDLGAELALLQQARAALRRDDSVTALALAREHARRFPHGSLTPERRAILERLRCTTPTADGTRAAGCP